MKKRFIAYLSVLPFFLLLLLNNVLLIIGTKLGWNFKTNGISLILTWIFLGVVITFLLVNILLIVISSILLAYKNDYINKDVNSLNERLTIYIIHLIWSMGGAWWFIYDLITAIKGVLSEVITMSLVVGLSILTAIVYLILIIVNRVRKKHN